MDVAEDVVRRLYALRHALEQVEAAGPLPALALVSVAERRAVSQEHVGCLGDLPPLGGAPRAARQPKRPPAEFGRPR